jgi:hypothetical protein
MRSLLIFGFLIFSFNHLQAQDSTKGLDIKPAIGIVGSPFKPTVSLMITYPLTPRWSVATHSLLSFLPTSNTKERYIKTNYNYSAIQNIGIGYSLYGKKRRASHTIRFMGGLKRIAFSETLANPELDEEVTIDVRTIVPEYGVMYDFSLGRGRCRFATRLYLPFHPIQYYPKGTLNNLAYLEVGAGIKLKKK